MFTDYKELYEFLGYENNSKYFIKNYGFYLSSFRIYMTGLGIFSLK